MMCLRCAELEERVAWLESELGIAQENDDFAKLRKALLLDRFGSATRYGGGMKAIIALYRARGRTLSPHQLMDAIPPRYGAEDDRDVRVVNVWICLARKLLGRDAIENVWGRGYRLSDAGIARTTEILRGPGAMSEAA